MSAPNTTIDSYQDLQHTRGAASTASPNVSTVDYLQQPQTDAELTVWVHNLVTGGKWHPSVTYGSQLSATKLTERLRAKTQKELWAVQPTLTAMKSLLVDDKHPLFESVAKTMKHSATMVHEVAKKRTQLAET
jgi:hypothetical protein